MYNYEITKHLQRRLMHLCIVTSLFLALVLISNTCDAHPGHGAAPPTSIAPTFFDHAFIIVPIAAFIVLAVRSARKEERV